MANYFNSLFLFGSIPPTTIQIYALPIIYGMAASRNPAKFIGREMSENLEVKYQFG